MKTSVRFVRTGEVRELEFEDFQKLILDQTISPFELVCDDVLTKDEWVTVDNVKVFHRLTENRHEVGERLKRQLEQERLAEQEKKETEQRFLHLKKHVQEFFNCLPEESTFALIQHFSRFQKMHCRPGSGNIYVSLCPSFDQPAFFQLNVAERRLVIDGDPVSCDTATMDTLVDLANRLHQEEHALEDDTDGMDGETLLLFDYMGSAPRCLIRWCPDQDAEARRLDTVNAFRTKLLGLRGD
ncbi:MAG: hypothetical protein WA705_15965 [Candidatus Ozemobacteraceae bacterium]